MKTDGEVWLEAWVAVASSSPCKEAYVATGWADYCLAEYKKRFINHDGKEYDVQR